MLAAAHAGGPVDTTLRKGLMDIPRGRVIDKLGHQPHPPHGLAAGIAPLPMRCLVPLILGDEKRNRCLGSIEIAKCQTAEAIGPE